MIKHVHVAGGGGASAKKSHVDVGLHVPARPQKFDFL